MPVFDFLLRLDTIRQRAAAMMNPPVSQPGEVSGCGVIRSSPPAVPSLNELEHRCDRSEARWLQTGMLLLSRNATIAAERCFRALLDLDRDRWVKSATCTANLGHALKLQGRLAEAEEWLLRAVQDDPDSVPIRKLLVEVQSELQRPAAVILAHVEHALIHAPNDDDLQNRKRQLDWDIEASSEKTAGAGEASEGDEP